MCCPFLFTNFELVDCYNVLSLGTFGAFSNVEFDPLAVFKIAVAISHNRTVMNKNVAAGILLNKAKSLCAIELFYSACLSI